MKTNAQFESKCGTSIRSSRFDQSIKSVEKLKAQLARARARVQQESRLAEKRKRYAERHRVDSECRMLGKMCQTIGLGNFRLEPKGEAAIGSIDAELVAGAIALLVEQLRELDDEQRVRIKASGSTYIQRYVADQMSAMREDQK